MRLFPCTTTILLIFYSFLISADVRADPFDGLRVGIRRRMAEDQIPSLAVAVARDGEIIWEEGFGWADRENRVRADEHTMYSLASISKPITATGLMVLVERGLIDLDAPANRHLGPAKLKACVGNAREATIRRLANHTSGLPLHYQFFYEDETYQRPTMDETIRRYGRLISRPGETYRYANMGYGILDHIIARASEMDFAQFMRREVFLPLDMTHTSVDIGPRLEKYAAVRYTSDQTPLPFYTFDHPGASAVFSSAHDLVRFGMFHLKQRTDDQKAILSEASIDEMQRPTAEISAHSGYGLGWQIATVGEDLRVVSHSGGMGGVNTLLTLVPKHKLVIVALVNTNTSLPRDVTRDIFEILAPEDAGRWQESQNGTHDNDHDAETTLSDLRGDWSGHVETYAGELPIELSFKDSGDVHVRLGEQLKTLLDEARLEDGYLRGRFSGDIQTDDANRRPYHLHVHLKRRDDVLNGSITAISLPGSRAGNALSYWVEVRRR